MQKKMKYMVSLKHARHLLLNESNDTMNVFRNHPTLHRIKVFVGTANVKFFTVMMAQSLYRDARIAPGVIVSESNKLLLKNIQK
jgi:hypothetical protein